jgi:hypothetical protein
VNAASPNRHTCKAVFELGEDVGLKADGQVDFGERSLVGVVASLLLTASARTKPAKHTAEAYVWLSTPPNRYA